MVADLKISRENISILVVDDKPELRLAASRLLKKAGYQVFEAASRKECFVLLDSHLPDILLLDVVLPDCDGRKVYREIKANPRFRQVYVLLLSSVFTSSDQQAEGLDLGADGYIPRPVPNRELLARVNAILRIKQAEDALRHANEQLETKVKERTSELADANKELMLEIEERKRAQRALEEALDEIRQLKDRLQVENVYLQKEINLEHNFRDIIGQSDALKYVLYRVEQVAPTDSTVLILGETGTGKELIARAIHMTSPRKARPLVKVNCASLPANLIESELFGHQKGAFTGAHNNQLGRFEVADGSTLFLDEIGELPIDLQAKLLRVLQDGEFERLGSFRTIRADVRLIAATNRNMEEAVRCGSFREDLFYRLNVFPLTIPPLRNRSEDIPLLANAFVQRISRKMGKEIASISNESLEALKSYSWPGNIRELHNTIERALIITQGPVLQIQPPQLSVSEKPRKSQLEDVERDHILRMLEQCKWQIEGEQGAAKVLGLNPGTLRSRMKKLGIKRPDNHR